MKLRTKEFAYFQNPNLMLLLQDGLSNYFKGLMLILCYLIVAASFFVHADPSSANGEFLNKNLLFFMEKQQ